MPGHFIASHRISLKANLLNQLKFKLFKYGILKREALSCLPSFSHCKAKYYLTAVVMPTAKISSLNSFKDSPSAKHKQ